MEATKAVNELVKLTEQPPPTEASNNDSSSMPVHRPISYYSHGSTEVAIETPVTLKKLKAVRRWGGWAENECCWEERSRPSCA